MLGPTQELILLDLVCASVECLRCYDASPSKCLGGYQVHHVTINSRHVRIFRILFTILPNTKLHEKYLSKY
jgi:hypothetical protein